MRAPRLQLLHSALDGAAAPGVNFGMKVKLLSLAALLVLTLASGAETPEKPKAATTPSGRPVRSAESLERKARSIAKLKAEDIPTTPDWPVLPDSTTAKVRTSQEVAQHAIAVCLTALKAEGADQETIEGLVKRYKAKKFFTAAEWEFVDNNAVTNSDRNSYLWRYEDLWVLMWVLGYVDEMDRPDRTCDVRKTVSYLSNRTLEQFLAEAKLRNISEILDEADLLYRYNGAVEDAKRRGLKAPRRPRPRRGPGAQRHPQLADRSAVATPRNAAFVRRSFFTVHQPFERQLDWSDMNNEH
ncbi:MAG: DUF4272 domain-containing protein [Lacunisphaera sp.]